MIRPPRQSSTALALALAAFSCGGDDGGSPSTPLDAGGGSSKPDTAVVVDAGGHDAAQGTADAQVADARVDVTADAGKMVYPNELPRSCSGTCPNGVCIGSTARNECSAQYPDAFDENYPYCEKNADAGYCVTVANGPFYVINCTVGQVAITACPKGCGNIDSVHYGCI